MGAVEPRAFLDRPGKLRDVARNHAIHAGLAHGFVAELSAVDSSPRPENRSRLQAGFREVFGERLGGGEMDADGAVLVAFLVDGKRGLFAVLMKVLDAQAAGGG